MAKKGLTQANTLRSNNTTASGYGIVYADEIIGGRSVKTRKDLDNLPDWVLGEDDGLDIGTTCYVQDEDCQYTYAGDGWYKSFKFIGLSNVTNDSQVKRSEMGQPLGVATLDKFGKVPESQLPSYVDDVLEFEDKSALPNVGESGKIYVTLDNNLTYRWTGSTYIKIGGSGGIVNVESIPDDYINALDESLQNNHK